MGLALAASLQDEAIDSDTHIHVTDQEQLLPLMKHNIAINNLPSALVSASVLNWGNALPNRIPTQPDILLAADCVYFEPSFPLLIDTMKQLIGPQTLCYFAQVKRRKADLRFIKEARKHFRVEDCRHDPQPGVGQGKWLYL